jgi:carbonic anhydrase/acetyltransferase-like protein (isoleucine patch superfamily)
MGAVILDKAVIGAGSIVGAGTVVSQGVVIPPRSLVLGTPGRVVRAVTDEEFQSISATTMRYLEYIKGYNFSELK